VWLAGMWSPAIAAPPYTLDQLLALAMQGNKGVQAAAAGVEAARAGVTTAGAFPNPEVEYTSGRVSAHAYRALQLVTGKPYQSLSVSICLANVSCVRK